ncbi:MAG TPA: S8 family serine peptidase [Candidatus Eisenbacteria bacterium]|nr:S8 family serine peptidase [Candidatus Eisenbacteria bacterium]
MVASSAFADVSKLDPRARIALQRLRGGERANAIQGEGRLSVSAVGELDVFVVGDVSRAQLEAAGARVRTALPGVFTAWIPEDRVEAVAALGGVTRIEGAEVDQVSNDLGSASTGATLFRGAGPTFAGLNGAGVIVANVDTGVDYDHEDFKDALGNTRILSIWDQTNGAGPAPAGFGYGTEWTQAQINSLASTAGDTHGHGSHTMGSAAGDGSQINAGSAPAFTYAGMAPMADIIVVDGSTTGSFSRTQMLDAATYVFGRATALGKNAVINMSIGSQSGPKDGTDPFELGIDALAGPGKIVVMSAGNDRGQPVHAEWFPGNPAVTHVISSATASPRFTAIRGYYEASEQLNVSITAPGGAVVGPVALGGISGGYPGPATANGNVYIENGVSLTSTGDKLVYIELNAATGAVISGTWTITFTPVIIGAAGGEIDLFRTSTNMTTSNFVVGNQPSEEIISGIATSVNSLAAGAYVTRRNWTDCSGTGGVGFGQPVAGNVANFSSPGPTRDGRMKPDVSAPGTAIASARSLDIAAACGTPDADLAGLRHVMNQGTSMAAPHVTGAVALLYQKYGALTPAQVQALIHGRAIVDGFVTGFGAAPNKDFGWGKLNLGDMSDPLCAVTAPNGGEVLVAGANTNLTWNASDAIGGVTGVDLEISRNNGGSWTTIATGVPNTGTFAWTVTGPATIQALLRVTAKDAASNAGVDVSNAVWTINDPVAVDPDDRPIAALDLEGVSPNPVRDEAVIDYAVPTHSDVSLTIYDLQGRAVAVLARGPHAPGRYHARWDVTAAARAPRAGVYFAHLEGAGVSTSRRLVVAH